LEDVEAAGVLEEASPEDFVVVAVEDFESERLSVR